jgi:hypothetical protein
MHRGGNNVLFDDLHVALFSNYDKYAMTFNPHLMQDCGRDGGLNADVTGGLSAGLAANTIHFNEYGRPPRFRYVVTLALGDGREYGAQCT